MVYSPSTRATEMKAADSTPDQMLGTTTRMITVTQPAPKDRPASERVTTSMEDSAASRARYA